MSVPARLGAFAAALALTFAASYAVGAAVDPILDDEVPAHDEHRLPDDEAPARHDDGTPDGTETTTTVTTVHDHAEGHG